MSTATPYVASPTKRVCAEAIDLVLLLLAASLGVGSIGDFGYVIEFEWAVPLLYFAYHTAFLWFWKGQSPGRRMFNILVIGVSGQPMTLLQSLGRPAIRVVSIYAMLFCLVFVDFSAASLMVAFPVALDLALMGTLPSRQTLSDLAAETIVIDAPPLQPHRAPAAPMYSATDAEFGIPPKRTKRIAIFEFGSNPGFAGAA